MSEEIREHCGLVVAHTLHDAYAMLKDLQHRGPDAVGILGIGDDAGRGRIDAFKWVGSINRFDLASLHKFFPGDKYHTYVGHLRYATKGKEQSVLSYAHPHTLGGNKTNYGDSIFISGCDVAMVHNGQVNDEHLPIINNASFLTDCDTEKLLRFYLENGEEGMLRKIPGAYTVAIADRLKKGVIVMRDRTGIRPGVLGFKDGKYIAASEDIALRKNGAILEEDLEPGTIYRLFPDGSYEIKEIVSPELAYCIMEPNYQADVESILNTVSVQAYRRFLGKQLAKEFPFPDWDYVASVPRSSETATRGYARALKIPRIDILNKKNSKRSFQGSNADIRKKSIDENLDLLPEAVERIRGKRVVLIDDSTIRGTVVTRVRKLMYEDAGVAEAVLLNYTPPIGIIGSDGEPRGCMYGIDMPPHPPPPDEYIARGRTLTEIADKVKMPVNYLSLEGLLSAFEHFGISRQDLCTFCIGGEKPF